MPTTVTPRDEDYAALMAYPQSSGVKPEDLLHAAIDGHLMRLQSHPARAFAQRALSTTPRLSPERAAELHRSVIEGR